jgi:hypothetical protein
VPKVVATACLSLWIGASRMADPLLAAITIREAQVASFTPRDRAIRSRVSGVRSATRGASAIRKKRMGSMKLEPPRLTIGPLTGRVYVITHGKILGEKEGREQIEASVKYDVTDQIQALNLGSDM